MLPILAQWLNDAPLYVILCVVAFGLQIGPLKVRGAVPGVWYAARQLVAVKKQLMRVEKKLVVLPEINERTKRIEGQVGGCAAQDTDLIRLSIPR